MQGTKFATVAKDVAGLSAEDMDLGALTRDEFLSSELAAVAFAAPEGGVTKPEPSDLGWHLFRVRKIELGSVRAFEQVREQLERDLRLGRATDALYDFANRVDDELGGGVSLEETASNLSVRFATLGPIDRKGRTEAGKNDALLPESPIFLEQAFAAEEGLDTGLVETPEGDYYVLRVDNIRPSALRSLDLVRREVLDMWQQEKRARATQAAGEELMEAAKGADMMARLAKEKGYRVRTTEPLLRDGSIHEAALGRSQLSTLFTLRPGDATSAPTPSGNSHVVATLVSISAPDPASSSEGLSKLRIAIADEMPTDITTQYRDALEAEAGGTLIYRRSLDNYFGDGS
jgi:peptidyl-prolyl cis-trans isomerase D